MTEHTKTDGLPGMRHAGRAAGADGRRARATSAWQATRSSATPARCCARSRAGKTGACDRYANRERRAGARRPGGAAAPHARERRRRRWCRSTAALPTRERAVAGADADWNGDLLRADEVFVTGIGSSTTYPDYKPAPFIVASQAHGVDMVTVVTEGIFSYCSFKVKIDTDRWLGPEQANVRCKGEVVGHVTTAEYGSQMLSLGGVHHLTGGSKKEGRVTVEMMQRARQQAGRWS